MAFGHFLNISISHKLGMNTFSGSIIFWRLLEKYEPLSVLYCYCKELSSGKGSYGPKKACHTPYLFSDPLTLISPYTKKCTCRLIFTQKSQQEAIAQWLVCRPVGMCKGIYSYQDDNVSTGAMVTTGYRFETTAQH